MKNTKENPAEIGQDFLLVETTGLDLINVSVPSSPHRATVHWTVAFQWVLVPCLGFQILLREGAAVVWPAFRMGNSGRDLPCELLQILYYCRYPEVERESVSGGGDTGNTRQRRSCRRYHYDPDGYRVPWERAIHRAAEQLRRAVFHRRQ